MKIKYGTALQIQLLVPIPTWAEIGGLAGARPLQRNFFSSPSLNNIYIFNLNNKTTNILAPLNFIFWFCP